MAQGYYFSKPVPADQFETFLLEKKPDEPQAAFARQGNQRRLSHDKHTYDAMHDPLTGLYNYSAFDMLLHDADIKHTALLLAEMDGYDELKESQGISIADHMLRNAASALKESFRSSDFICRIREKEFAVILPRVHSDQREVILEKVKKACEGFRGGEYRYPVNLYVGLAFGDSENSNPDLYHEADQALTQAKQS